MSIKALLILLSLAVGFTAFGTIGTLGPSDASGQLPAFGKREGSGAQVSYPSIDMEAGATAPTRVVISSVGVNTIIVNAPRTANTWDVSHLTWQVGHLEGAAYPGQGSNVVLGGHRYLGVNNANPSMPGPFVNLEKLQAGARIQVYAGSTLYVYQVIQQFKVAPTEVWVVSPTASETLTLLTCDTWNPETQMFDKRLVVRASLVEAQFLEGGW